MTKQQKLEDDLALQRQLTETAIKAMAVIEASEHAKAARIAELKSALEAERARATALQAFKDYVHKRLDEAGIPTHPNGKHSKEGCRIGDRLDIILAAEALSMLPRAALTPEARQNDGET